MIHFFPKIDLKSFSSERFNSTQAMLETFLNHEVRIVGEHTLRKEYQPNLITQHLYSAFNTKNHALKTHIGCGGGKTTIFMVSILLAMLYGKATRVSIVAPTIALTRQLEIDFMKFYKRFYDGGAHISGLRLVNVSSDGKSKAADLTDEDLAAEHDDDEKISKKELSEIKALAKELEVERVTTMNHDELEDMLDEDVPTVYFVCKPSFIKNFRQRVKNVGTTIDIGVFDEYHNLISQNTNEAYTSMINDFAKVCTRRWFFSATKRAGQKMSWRDAIFGEETADIQSSKLVEWGYLVKHLRVFFISASDVRGITNAIKEFFIGIKVKHPEKFYREAAVVIAVMLRVAELKIKPKALVFGSKVEFIRLMMKSENFKAKIASMFETLTLMYQIDGETDTPTREMIFKALRGAANNVATLLLNHSTMKEGIDVTKFNTALIARGMSDHGLQQALGRIQRIDHDDPSKDTCFLFLYVDGEDSEEVMKKMLKAVTHIHYAIGDWDASIEPLWDDRVGDVDVDVEDYRNVGDLPEDLLEAKVRIDEQMIERLEACREELKLEEKAEMYRAALLADDMGALL